MVLEQSFKVKPIKFHQNPTKVLGNRAEKTSMKIFLKSYNFTQNYRTGTGLHAELGMAHLNPTDFP